MTANTKLIGAIASALFAEHGEEATEWLEGGGRANVARIVAEWCAAVRGRRRAPGSGGGVSPGGGAGVRARPVEAWGAQTLLDGGTASRQRERHMPERAFAVAAPVGPSTATAQSRTSPVRPPPPR